MHVMHVDSLRRLKVASASRNHAAGSVCQNRISVIFLGLLMLLLVLGRLPPRETAQQHELLLLVGLRVERRRQPEMQWSRRETFLARWRGLEEQSIEVPVQTYIFQHLFWCILTNTKLRIFSAARELQARYSTVLYIIIQ